MKEKRIRKHLFEKKIEELYFDKLEENCVEFLHYEDIGNGQTETHIKDEYIETVENMIDYIWGLDTWIGKWTLELWQTMVNESEEIDTQTEYGIRKISNKKGGSLI